MKMSKVMDEWETFDFQFILYDLLEMANQFDTSDEVNDDQNFSDSCNSYHCRLEEGHS